jgi:CheY-like chemotaxis protein
MCSFLLIADSNKAVLELHAQFLTDQGYRVDTASDRLACVDSLRRFWPDVIILDRSLLWGGADGLLAQMRDGNDLPPVPVILTSTSEFAAADFKSPVVARLMKPFRLSALLDAIASAQEQLKVLCEQN